MEVFTVTDVREHAGELVRSAESGKLSIITKHGKPVFVAVPFDDMMLKEGVATAVAINLFDGARISLKQAAQMAGRSLSEMFDLLGRHGIPVTQATAGEREQEPADFD